MTTTTLVVPQSKKIYTGVVIFLHGSGGTGKGIRERLRILLDDDFQFAHLKVIFPTAPLRPYTLLNGDKSNVWFDRFELSPFVPEHLPTIEDSAKTLSRLIQTEIDNGIPPSRIIIGGYSMGGAMAFHMGYKYWPQIAGVFALSSFLNNGTSVYKSIRAFEGSSPPKLFQCHGTKDELVSVKWGEKTNKELSALGVSSEFQTFQIDHELNLKEINMLKEWIYRIIPENKSML